MTLEGGVAEYLSHMQNKKTCCIQNICEYPVPQEKDDSIIYCLIDINLIIKWKQIILTTIKMITIVIL